ncbi:MAG: hypothetical protein FWE32_11795 [Oscillospiraceae bacterium]|nr:hypothetical protein [Oscillospiraceae bacterium]
MAIGRGVGIKSASPLDSNMYESRKGRYKRSDDAHRDAEKERQSARDQADFGAHGKTGRTATGKAKMEILLAIRESNILIARRVHQLKEALANYTPPASPPKQADSGRDNGSVREHALNYSRPTKEKSIADIRA